MSTTVPIRYMGTKRQLAQHVRRLAHLASPNGSLTDLFSGMGSVAAEHAGLRNVITNDVLAFTGVLARSRFLGADRKITPAAQMRSSLSAPVGPSIRLSSRALEKPLDRSMSPGCARLSGT